MAKRYMPGMPLWVKTILGVLGIGILIFLVASVIGCCTGESAIEVFQPDEQIEQEAPADDSTNDDEDPTEGEEGSEDDTTTEENGAETLSFTGSNGQRITLKF